MGCPPLSFSLLAIFRWGEKSGNENAFGSCLEEWSSQPGNVVLTNMRRLGMLSDCTRGFLYSQISSGWMTLWKGSKNSVKLKQNKETRVRAEHSAAALTPRENRSCTHSGGEASPLGKRGDHRLPQWWLSATSDRGKTESFTETL